MNICFVVNKNYIGQLKVAIKSLFETNDSNIDLYILENDLSNEDEEDLVRFVSSYKQNIHFIKMSDSYFTGLPKMGYDQSYTAYFKIMIPYVLDNLDKVLYLDCDLLVRKSLKELYDRETSNFISAALDIKMNKGKQDHIKSICGHNSSKYFNSGVILFDFKYKDQIVSKEEMIDYILNNKDIIKYHDQDILNHFYIDKCDTIDILYNYHTIYYSFKEIFKDNNIKKAYIIHYANWKPWNSNYIGKAYKMYLNEYNSLKEKENLNYLKKRNIFSMLKLIFKYIF